MNGVPHNSPQVIHGVFPIVLTLEEIQTMAAWKPPGIGSIEYRDSLVIHLLLLLGLRRSEVSGLRIRHFHFARSQFWIFGFPSKGGGSRSIPIPPFLYKRLRARWEFFHLEDPEYFAVYPRRSPHKPLGPSQIWRIARSRSQELIGRPVRPHLFRHSIATAWLMSGTDLKTVQELLGHQNIATTSRYLHSTPDALVRAVNAIETRSPDPTLFQFPARRPS